MSGNYDKPKKKAPAISFAVESQILADIDHQITHPMGCIKRLVYYILVRFGIRAVKELHAVKDCDLVLEKDDGGELVKYGERISKNRNPTATKFDDHHFCKPIWTYEKDFVLTFKQYVRHCPAKEKDSEPRAFFLQPIVKPRGFTWYAVTPVGVNNLSKWLNTMAAVVSPETEICNKSGRVSLITRLAAADTPAADGMRISGHKNVKSYEKYDRTRECKINACMDIISQPDCHTFSKVLTDQIAKDEVSRKSLGEISSNVPSTVLQSSDFGDGKASSSTMTGIENDPPISSAVVPPVIVPNASFPPVPVHAANLSAAIKSGASNVAEVFDDGTLVKKQSEVAFQKEEDDYDDEFYSELSKSYPESARAIGKYVAPAISNQGTFNSCTFNLVLMLLHYLVL